MNNKIITVIVTFNRTHILKACLNSLVSQSLFPDSIIVIDNGSSDHTHEMLKKNFPDDQRLNYFRMEKNIGGAGGFNYGARLAVERGAEWIWLMDDDCLPENNCLEKLVKGIKNKSDIYSPIVLSSSDRSTTLWGIKAKVNSGCIEVPTLPFNGFIIHRDSIMDIGYPDPGFFIYGDDTEYNLRAKASGRKIMMVTDSIMFHPYKNKLSSSGIISMFSSKLWVYYKFRNAIIIYNKYKYISINQVIMFTAAIFFFILTLNLKQAGLWFRGLADGLCNRLYVRDL